MLRVSKLADYGTVVMVYLARHSQDRCNAKSIAAATHLTAPTVSKLLKILAKSELLQSTRGAQGGYVLMRPADEISVAEIIHAVEGQSGITECSHAHGECALEPICQIQANWQLINTAIEAALDSVSLAELAKPTLSISRIDVSQIRGLSKSGGIKL